MAILRSGSVVRYRCLRPLVSGPLMPALLGKRLGVKLRVDGEAHLESIVRLRLSGGPRRIRCGPDSQTDCGLGRQNGLARATRPTRYARRARRASAHRDAAWLVVRCHVLLLLCRLDDLAMEAVRHQVHYLQVPRHRHQQIAHRLQGKPPTLLHAFGSRRGGYGGIGNQYLIELIRELWRNRELTLELTRRELFQGHTSHVFGGLWALANPLITLLLYFLVFRYIFPSRVGDRSGEVFLLAGLVQWVVLAEVMVRASHVGQQNANLVKQISFPLEVLVAKTVLSWLFVQAVMSFGMLVLILFEPGPIGFGVLPLWLLAVILQAVLMLGLTLILASLTPFAPDTAEVVGMFIRLGMFITPILYVSDTFGPLVKALFHANPFSYFAWIHQGALVHQSVTDPLVWLAAFMLAASVLWRGERMFRELSPAFTVVL
jgi:lipopolysaccharide transport system permease protein